MMESRNSATEELLRTLLSVAVPMWIERLRDHSWSYIQERAQFCAQVVAEKGDNILFRSKRKGESAHAFNRLAEGIACLAFAPGGVRFLGNRYIAFHPDSSNRSPRDLDDALNDALSAMENHLRRKPRTMP